MSARVTPEDLLTAAEWLDQYEGGAEGPVNESSCMRVAAWLRAEADRRTFLAAAREVSRKTGAPMAHSKSMLKRIQAQTGETS